MTSASPQASPSQASPTVLPSPTVQAFVCDVNEGTTTWTDESQPLFTLLQRSENKACIIFTDTKELRSNVERRKKLQEWFPHTPAVFWSDTCVDHNGFFGCHTSSTPMHKPTGCGPTGSSTNQTATSVAADHQEVVSTYFRLIVKILLPAKAQNQGSASSTSSTADYAWHEMGFMSLSSGTKSLLLCFDVPKDSIKSLHQMLPKNTDQIRGPFGLHILVLEELVKLYDQSVWAMAKKVRGIEKQRLAQTGRLISRTPSLPSNIGPLPDETFKLTDFGQTAQNFEHLFEISRHLAHSVETTQIATEVVERMKHACESLHLAHGTSILLTRVQKLGFLHSLLRGLSARSVSNEKRLTSEQVLLSNMISQQDSKVNKKMSNFSSQIAMAAREDGAAMKTIAVVTLTFLPATFVTALLGMNFFTVDSGRLTSTKDVWIFFVIAVPLTFSVLCFWWWWQRKEAKKAMNHNEKGHEKDVELGDESS